MAELIALSPLGNADPLAIGRCTLSEVDPGPMTSIAPFRGKDGEVSKALRKSHKIDWPGPNETTLSGKTRCIWFGREMALLTGASLDDDFAKHAALTDHSDAWVCVALEGSDAEAVLARLVPVDLRIAHFKVDQTARTMLGHMNSSFTRTAEYAFLIMVFRSMASTLVHDLQIAMESVAARG